MCHTGGLEKFQNVPGIDIGQMRPRSSKFKYAMEELTKKVAPGFQSNKDINDRINGLSPDTKQCIKNSAQAMKQLEYLKWGTVGHDKALEKIEKTKN